MLDAGTKSPVSQTVSSAAAPPPTPVAKASSTVKVTSPKGAPARYAQAFLVLTNNGDDVSQIALMPQPRPCPRNSDLTIHKRDTAVNTHRAANTEAITGKSAGQRHSAAKNAMVSLPSSRPVA